MMQGLWSVTSLFGCGCCTICRSSGKAARALSQEFRDEHAQVAWRDVVGIRNVLVHHYFEIDLDLVSEIVTRDLPPLKAALQKLLPDDHD